MSTLQPRPNINHLLRFSTMYQHQIYIRTNVTPAFLFYIECPEAFVSLRSEAEFLKAHSSINIINGVEKDWSVITTISTYNKKRPRNLKNLVNN